MHVKDRQMIVSTMNIFICLYCILSTGADSAADGQISSPRLHNSVAIKASGIGSFDLT